MNDTKLPEVEEVVKPNDPYGFGNLTATELRKVISDLVRSNEEVAAEKKDYVGAANDTIKEGKARIGKALEFLALAEKTGKDIAHSNNVTDFLTAKNAKL